MVGSRCAAAVVILALIGTCVSCDSGSSGPKSETRTSSSDSVGSTDSTDVEVDTVDTVDTTTAETDSTVPGPVAAVTLPSRPAASAPSSPEQPDGQVAAQPDVLAPAPPAIAEIASASPDQLAITVAAATAPGSEGVEGAWIKAYELAGIPVLGANGLGLGNTGQDAFGPLWSQVWMVTGGGAGQGVRLTDVVKVLISPEDRAPSEEEATAAAASLITDLGAGVQSPDPIAAFTADFIVAKLAQAGTKASLLDPSLDLTTTRVDVATGMFIGWVAMRALASTLLTPTTPSGFVAAGTGSANRSVAAAPISRRADGDFKCGADDQLTSSTGNSVIGKLAAGVKLPGIEVKGFIEKIVSWNEHIVSLPALEKFNKIASRVNALTTIAAALLQYSALDYGAAGEKLDRTRTQTDGARVDLRFDITLDPEHQVQDQGTKKALCALSFVSNVLGVSLSLPEPGPVPGVEVIFTGGDGFGDRVLFADYKQMKQDANAEGSVFVGVLGKGQPKALPVSTPRVDKEYTLEIEVTPEPVDGNALFNTVFDSLSGVTTLGLGLVAPVIDILKTAHWDLEDAVFPMLDWQPQIYEVTGEEEGVTLAGRTCDLTAPFQVNGAGSGVNVVMTFTPTASNAGFWSYVGSGSGISISGEGGYTIVFSEQGGTIDMTGAGQAGGHSRGWESALTLTAAEGTC